MRRVVVPELPQCSREPGAVSRPLRTVTVFLSLTGVMSTPSWRNTRAVDFTSSPVRIPETSLLPVASAANINARCEMLLSPGGVTEPDTCMGRT